MNEDGEQKNAHLESLNQQLEQVRKYAPSSNSTAQPPGDAARGAIDFATATVVGTVAGYGIDYWQQTLPWGLLGGLFLGVAAGIKLMFEDEKRKARRTEANEKRNETNEK